MSLKINDIFESFLFLNFVLLGCCRQVWGVCCPDLISEWTPCAPLTCVWPQVSTVMCDDWSDWSTSEGPRWLQLWYIYIYICVCVCVWYNRHCPLPHSRWPTGTGRTNCLHLCSLHYHELILAQMLLSVWIIIQWDWMWSQGWGNMRPLFLMLKTAHHHHHHRHRHYSEFLQRLVFLHQSRF